MTEPKIDFSTFQQWAHDNAKLALAVCEAQAAAEVTKEKVAAYIQPIFDSFNFICEGTAAERFDASPREGETEKYVGRKIKTPNDSEFWMLHGPDESEAIQEKLRQYYAACDAEHRRQGFTNLKEGQSPDLVLASLHTDAENELIKSAEPLFGIDQVYGKNREKYLKLLTGACLKALSEQQNECGKANHSQPEPQPLFPTKMRCSNCWLDLGEKVAA